MPACVALSILSPDLAHGLPILVDRIQSILLASGSALLAYLLVLKDATIELIDLFYPCWATSAEAFSQRIPPVQNIATLRCLVGSMLSSTH